MVSKCDKKTRFLSSRSLQFSLKHMYINKVRMSKKVQKGPRIYWEGEGHKDLLRKASYLEFKKQTGKQTKT